MQMVGLFLPCLFLVLAAATLAADAFSAPQPAASTPTPTYDPLAIPTLPENPTQEEIGKHVYYYNCMPCHGDQGQGLTEAWRQVWEEDHRDCWGRGCHGGRGTDESFPIPTIIPAIILDGDALQRYTTPQELFAYLQSTHPPQAPGRLDDKDYQALVAYLWVENHKAPLQATLQSTSTHAMPVSPDPTFTQVLPPSPEPSPTIPAEDGETDRSLALTCGSVGMLSLVVLGVVVGLVRRQGS